MKVNAEIKTSELSTGFAAKHKSKMVLHSNLNLSLKTGELVCILGPNGAGKSTLIKTLLGFVSPLSGKVLVNEVNLQSIPIRELAQIISIVLTEKIDDMYLTVNDIVSTGRYPYGGYSGRLSDKDRELIEMAMKLVGIESFMKKIFAKLSDGEKQKVMIARAIAQDTPLVFLDEPVAYLDPPSRIIIMQLLQKLVREMGKGILMATHDMDSALNYADEIWLLGKDGNWEAGKPSGLLNSGMINRFFDAENVAFDANEKRFTWSGK